MALDWSCLIGLCTAAAQQAADAAATATSSGAGDGTPEGAGGDMARDLSDLVTWIGVGVLVFAQFAATPMLRLYRRTLLKFMNVSSRKALGLAALEPRGDFTAEDLLAALEGQRRRVLGVLLGVVLLYSLAAAWLYAFGFDSARAFTVSVAVSFLLFLSFSGPVVLLGVSAANFGRLFWTWFAPAAFAAVAMQIVVASVAQMGEADAVPVLLKLFGAIAAVTLTGVALREFVHVAWWQRLAGWIRAHRWASAGIGLVVALVLLALLDTGADMLVDEVAEDMAGGSGGTAGSHATGEAAGVATSPVVDAESGTAAVAAGPQVPPSFADRLVIGCALAAVAITACYFTIVDRSKRIVVPLLAAALFTVVVLTFAGTVVLAGEGASDARTLVSLLMSLALALMLAYFVLSWIGLAYERKVFSDAQFQVFCWMVSVAGVVIFTETMVNGALLIDPHNRDLALATLAALAAYWVLIRWLVRPLLSDRRLLVLRVFAQDSRGERLLDEIEYRWRFIGPIMLIGGPDVAARTIDPAKAADFLRGRLRQAFVPNRMALHKRVAAMDDTPDPDGRYRVNEFYCPDDLWKEAVQLLLDSSDAIVLDLRGFTAARRGTAYEIGLLAGRGALARTVCLVDATTDRDAVQQALHAGDVAVGLQSAQLIEVESAMDGGRLVEALVRRMPPVRAALPPAAVPLGVAAGD